MRHPEDLDPKAVYKCILREWDKDKECLSAIGIEYFPSAKKAFNCATMMQDSLLEEESHAPHYEIEIEEGAYDDEGIFHVSTSLLKQKFQVITTRTIEPI